jgi:hypothetical protein
MNSILEEPGSRIKMLKPGQYGRFTVNMPENKRGRFTVTTVPKKYKPLANYLPKKNRVAYHKQRVQQAINAVRAANRERYQKAVKNLQNRHKNELNKLQQKHIANENALYNKHEAETRKKLARLLNFVN